MINFSIQNLIDTELRKNEKKREQKSWYPSSLGSCLTGAYLQRMGVKPKEEIEPRTLRVFHVGNLFENWLTSLIEKNATIEKQVRIQLPKYDMSGYADFVLTNPEGKIVYEVKSKHSKSFWHMDKLGKGAQESHKMQIWTYLKALNIPEGRIVYVSKDDLCILEYPIFLNDKKLEELVLTELGILNESWKQKLPPPPLTDEKDWRVKYCRVHSDCINQKVYLKL